MQQEAGGELPYEMSESTQARRDRSSRRRRGGTQIWEGTSELSLGLLKPTRNGNPNNKHVNHSKRLVNHAGVPHSTAQGTVHTL